MKLDHVFPIPIVRVTIDPVMIDHSLNLVNQYIEDEKLFESNNTKELLTTFYSSKDFLGKIKDNDMLSLVNLKSREFLNLKGFNKNCYLEITSWLQLYPPNTHFNKHDHYGAILSGVIYLQTPINCGNLRFYNPAEGRRATDVFFDRLKVSSNEYNYSYVEYTPVKGEMIMFEPWLQHSVDMNASNENRIAISFNIWGDIDGGR